MIYYKTQVLETLSFEKNRANPKNDLVDPHRTKNGQNAPSCSVQQNVSPILLILYTRI